jgi:predicted transcriptional regulator of viral defense system
MGEIKHLRKVEALFDKSPVVDARSIARIVGGDYSKQLIHNLLSQGKIKRLSKGFYTTRDDPSLAVFCFTPAYLGLQDALSFHGLWEQETVRLILTSKRVRQGLRGVMGKNVMIRRLEKKYLFGFDYYRQGDSYLLYSDVEKTLIDLLYFKEKPSEETLTSILAQVDKKKLYSYLQNYPHKFQKRVSLLL